MTKVVLSISTLPYRLAVCRLKPASDVPEWAQTGVFCSITRTPDELSIICAEDAVPVGIRCERDWRAFKLDGPFDFSMVGVLASVLEPLAVHAVSVLTVGTYDTDYVLVKAGHYERAVVVLTTAGHRVRRV